VIILDTNVLSAIMRAEPDATVIRWIERQDRRELWTTSINIFELQYGIELLADIDRRRRLGVSLDQFLKVYLSDRILAYDAGAARAAAALEAARKRSGRAVGSRDTQIAGVAIANRAAICTRNVRHFEDAGVTILNPWA
jgi:predicted nucleic acid-binding protein